MINCCSQGTVFHFSLQSSHLNICYYPVDSPRQLSLRGPTIPEAKRRVSLLFVAFGRRLLTHRRLVCVLHPWHYYLWCVYVCVRTWLRIIHFKGRCFFVLFCFFFFFFLLCHLTTLLPFPRSLPRPSGVFPPLTW